MQKELQTRQMADFALSSSFNDIGEKNIDQLKKHLLDALGSLLFSTTQTTPLKLLKEFILLGEDGVCKVPMLRGLSYDRAAQWYTALIRYPDFMDNFIGKESMCHPSDNIGVLLAASQFKLTSGKDFLTAMAVAYQMQCRLVLEIPVMKTGIDHTALLAYSTTAAIARLIDLTEEETARAFGIAGTSINPIVNSRASYTTEWKGFASSLVALDVVDIAFLTREEITGPVSFFEEPKGFEEVFGMKLDYDWSKETFELISKCILKPYNAEIHAQSAIEAALELRREHSFSIDEIDKIDITTFLTAYHIIGSGAYGDRKTVHTKEQADHSLFYLLAVALLDGEIYPEQLETKRIAKSDVQSLLQKIYVHTSFPLHKPLALVGILDPYTDQYPNKLRVKIRVHLKNKKQLLVEKEDYHGFFTRPLSWEDVVNKFKRLSAKAILPNVQSQIIDTVKNLENEKDLSALIALISIQKK